LTNRHHQIRQKIDFDFYFSFFVLFENKKHFQLYATLPPPLTMSRPILYRGEWFGFCALKMLSKTEKSSKTNKLLKEG